MNGVGLSRFPATSVLPLSFIAMFRILVALCLCSIGASCVISMPVVVLAEGPIDFVRDVQPILAEHCLHCHGADPDARQSGLRLDVPEEALRGGDSGESAIVPGDPGRGAFLARILSTDESEVMPPPVWVMVSCPVAAQVVVMGIVALDGDTVAVKV